MLNTQMEYNTLVNAMSNEPHNHHTYLDESCETVLANPLFDPVYYLLVVNWE